MRYDPSHGSLLTQDPIGLAGGVNLYAYAGNNPSAFSDPYGLCVPINVCLAVAGALIGGSTRIAYNLYKGNDWKQGVGSDMARGAAIGLTFGLAAPALAVADATLATGTATAGPAVAQAVSKLPRPETPGGMSLASFGQNVMGWGRGSAEAVAQIGKLSADKLREAGVTVQMAQKWVDFYANEVARNANNPSAAGRAELMNHVVQILKE